MGLVRGLRVQDALVDWGEGVPSSVSVEIAGVNLYVDGLFYAPSEPTGLTIQDLDILITNRVSSCGSVLRYGRRVPMVFL